VLPYTVECGVYSQGGLTSQLSEIDPGTLKLLTATQLQLYCISVQENW